MPLAASSSATPLATDVSRKDREIARLSHEVTTLTLTVMHLQSDIDVRDAQIRTLKSSSGGSSTDGEVTELMELLGGLQQETQLLRQQLAQKDALVDALSTKMDGQVINLVDVVKKKDLEIAELHADLSRLRADHIRVKRIQDGTGSGSKTPTTPVSIKRSSLRESFGNTLEFNKLNGDLASRDEEIVQLTATVARYQHELEEIQAADGSKAKELLEKDREIEAFKQSIEIMANDLDRKSTEIAKLTEQCKTLEAELVRLSEATQNNLRSSRALEDKVEELEELNMNLDLQLSQAKDDYASMNSSITAELTQKCNELELLKKEIDSLKEVNKAQASEADSLLSDNSALRKSNEQLQLNLRNSITKLDAQQDHIAAINAEKHASDEEIVLLKDRLNILQTQESNNRSEITNLSSSLTKKDEQIAVLQKQVETIPSLLAEKESLTLDLRKSTDSLKAATDTIDRLTEEVADKKNKIRTYKRDNESMFEDLRVHNNSMAQLQSDLKRLSESASQREAELTEQAKKLKVALSDGEQLARINLGLTEDLQTKTEQVEKLENDLSAAKLITLEKNQELERVSALLDQREHDLEVAAETISTMKNSTDSLEKKATGHETRVLELTVENDRLVRELMECREALDRTKQQIRELEIAQAAKNEKIDTLEKELQRSTELYSSKDAELLHASQRLSLLEEENKALETTVKDSLKQVSATTEQLDTLQRSVAEYNRNVHERDLELEALKNEAEMSNTKLANLLAQESSKDDLIEGLKRQVNEFSNKLLEAKQAQQESSRRCAELETDYYTLQCSLEEKQAGLQLETEKCTNMAHKLAEAVYLAEKYEGEKAQLVSQLQQTREDLKEVEKEAELVKTTLKEKITECDGLIVRLSLLEDEHEVLKTNYTRDKGELKEKEKQMEDLENELLVAEDNVRELTNEMDEMRRQLESVLHEKQLQEIEVNRVTNTLNMTTDTIKKQSAERTLLMEKLRLKEEEYRIPQESLIKMAFYLREKGDEVTKLNELLAEKQKTIDDLLLQAGKTNDPPTAQS
ncbi:Coiled-coil protein [Giardia lamblia P15]|uniref:Coiled-coil protein n=1 Tax=Giardia intestinalis (strain P15) TaxID=658858 RepID=E1F2B0_GIAIA|nr:Coiled-coil protein [Giardia lamblia P15]